MDFTEDTKLQFCDAYDISREELDNIMGYIIEAFLYANKVNQNSGHFPAQNLMFDAIDYSDNRKLAFAIYSQIIANLTK